MVCSRLVSMASAFLKPSSDSRRSNISPIWDAARHSGRSPKIVNPSDRPALISRRSTSTAPTSSASRVRGTVATALVQGRVSTPLLSLLTGDDALQWFREGTLP
jgi:hypothetical protein